MAENTPKVKHLKDYKKPDYYPDQSRRDLRVFLVQIEIQMNGFDFVVRLFVIF